MIDLGWMSLSEDDVDIWCNFMVWLLLFCGGDFSEFWVCDWKCILVKGILMCYDWCFIVKDVV